MQCAFLRRLHLELLDQRGRLAPQPNMEVNKGLTSQTLCASHRAFRRRSICFANGGNSMCASLPSQGLTNRRLQNSSLRPARFLSGPSLCTLNASRILLGFSNGQARDGGMHICLVDGRRQGAALPTGGYIGEERRRASTRSPRTAKPAPARRKRPQAPHEP